jgi:hypothetical protein
MSEVALQRHRKPKRAIDEEDSGTAMFLFEENDEAKEEEDEATLQPSPKKYRHIENPTDDL